MGKRVNPLKPSRIQLAPLDETDDYLLRYWAAINNRSVPAQVVSTIKGRLRENQRNIMESLEKAARIRGLTLDQVKTEIIKDQNYLQRVEPVHFPDGSTLEEE